MRDRFLQMLVPAIVVLTLVVAVRHVYAQEKQPVPAAESQQPARKATAEIYGERFQQAKTAAEKTALATEMIEAATKVQDGSPDQYVLLKLAADVAAGAGDAPTALQAVEEMAERFEVPGPKLTAETLLAAAGNASTTSQHKAVGESVLKIADAVAGAEEYKLALDLCGTARSSAQKARQYPAPGRRCDRTVARSMVRARGWIPCNSCLLGSRCHASPWRSGPGACSARCAFGNQDPLSLTIRSRAQPIAPTGDRHPGPVAS